MRMITMLSNIMREFNYARNIGITNDAGLMGYFKAEYKTNPDGEYEYWISTNDVSYPTR